MHRCSHKLFDYRKSFNRVTLWAAVLRCCLHQTSAKKKSTFAVELASVRALLRNNQPGAKPLISIIINKKKWSKAWLLLAVLPLVGCCARSFATLQWDYLSDGGFDLRVDGIIVFYLSRISLFTTLRFDRDLDFSTWMSSRVKNDASCAFQAVLALLSVEWCYSASAMAAESSRHVQY